MDIIIDCKRAKDFGLCIVDRPSIPTAEIETEETQIRGKHGSLVEKFCYQDVTLSVDFNFLEENINFKNKFHSIKKWLLDAETLTFTDELDSYRKIKKVIIEDADNDIEEYGYFTVSFLLDPFYYIKADNVVLTNPGEFENIGNLESKPIIYIKGTGDITLDVNGKPYELKDVDQEIILNSDIMHAYKEENDMWVSKNHLMSTPSFPFLNSGTNAVRWTGDVTEIEIETRGVKL